jgi:hypothetical protein
MRVLGLEKGGIKRRNISTIGQQALVRQDDL